LLVSDSIDERVEFAQSRLLPRLEACDRFSQHVSEFLRGKKVACDLFDFRVVEERWPGLVPHQRTFPVATIADERVGRHMDDVGLDAEACADGPVDIVPGVGIVGGDVEILVEGGALAEETNEVPCEVLASRQGPWSRPVSRHDHRPAFEHAMGHDRGRRRWT
jgi:hypothetical protein